MKNWKTPTAILVLLFIAMAFRWEDLGSRTVLTTTYNYKIDHWNGAIYEYGLSPAGYNRRQENGKGPTYIPLSSEALTIVWDLAIGASVIWLLYGLSKSKKEVVKNNVVHIENKKGPSNQAEAFNYFQPIYLSMP